MDTVLEKVNERCASLTTLVESIPSTLEHMLLSRFRIDGVMPVTMSDIASAAAATNQLIRDEIASLRQSFLQPQPGAGTLVSAHQVVHHNSTSNDDDMVDSVGERFYWSGKWHMVPVEFSFPKCTVKNMWFRWHLGQLSCKIGPFRKLWKDYRTDIPTSVRYLVDKAAKVMLLIEKVARDPQHGSVLQASQPIDSINCGYVFDKVYPIILAKLYPNAARDGSFRANDLKYTTLYEHISKFE